MTKKYKILLYGLAVMLIANLTIMAIIIFRLNSDTLAWAEKTSRLRIEVSNLSKKHRDRNKNMAVLLQSKEEISYFKNDVLGKRNTGIKSIMKKIDELIYRFRLKRTLTTYKQAEIKKTDLEKINIQFAVQGTYEDIRYFINALERSKDFLVLEGLGLIGGKRDNLIQLNISISSYFVRGKS